jgi:Tfp pilus assembly protein PilV
MQLSSFPRWLKFNCFSSRNNFIQEHPEGFSLIETVIAMTTLGVCLAYAMPLFLYAKLNNSKSEIRTGALMVSQRIFDDIRSQPITSLPTYDSSGVANVINIPANVGATQSCTVAITTNCVTDTERLQTRMMGRQYQAKITYCESATDCADNYRKFKIEVNYRDNKVYELEGTYTDFK